MCYPNKLYSHAMQVFTSHQTNSGLSGHFSVNWIMEASIRELELTTQTHSGVDNCKTIGVWYGY